MMKTRILSIFALGLFFCAGLAFSPSAEKGAAGPELRGPKGCLGGCPPGYRCVHGISAGSGECIPKGNGN
jgi:hypothetical protein